MKAKPVKRSQKITSSTFEKFYGNHNSDFDVRYGDGWKRICALSHDATGGICSCCKLLKSNQVHHMIYKDSMGAIAGREFPGVHVVPVCSECHDSICHSTANWIRDKKDPVLGNRNTDVFINFLRNNFLELNHAKYI